MSILKFKVRIEGKDEVMTWSEIHEAIAFGNTITEDMLRQFTGMVDKNDVEIYERDIVKEMKVLYDWDKPEGEERYVEERIHKVIFEGGWFKAEASDFGWEGEDLIGLYECEIIGNEIDNPELLINE